MSRTSPQQDEPKNDDSITIWLKMPYCGDQSQQLLKSIEGKLIKCVRPGNKLFFKTVYTITKGQFFTNNKDRTPVGFKANVVYISVALVVLHNILVGKTEIYTSLALNTLLQMTVLFITSVCKIEWHQRNDALWVIIIRGIPQWIVWKVMLKLLI